MTTIKKLDSLLLAFVLFFALIQQGLAAPQPFNDIALGDDAHYYPATQYLFEEGIFLGHPDGSFRPGEFINRAELMMIVIRTLGIEPDPNVYRDCYVDVTDQQFAPAVCYATEQGWVQGYEGNVFRPEEDAKVVEIMKMILYPLFPQEMEYVVQEVKIEEGEDFKWYIPYYRLSGEKGFNAGDLDHDPYSNDISNNYSTRAKVAHYLFEALLTRENNWPMYDDHLSDQLFLEQEKDYLLSASYPCYHGYTQATPSFLGDYVNEAYGIDHIDWRLRLEDEFFQDNSNFPFFNFNGFCLLENGDHLMFGYSLENNGESGQEHLVRFDSEGNLIEDQSIICEPWHIKMMGELPRAQLSYVDPDTYEMIDCLYAKDAERVYGMGYYLIDEADPATFEVLKFPYSKDAYYAYYLDAVISEDPDNFHVFAEVNELFPMALYTKDDEYVYFDGFIIDEADLETFEVVGVPEMPAQLLQREEFFYNLLEDNALEAIYAKDKNNWYLGDDVIEEVDYETFEPLDFFFAKDNNGIYLLHQKSGSYSDYYGLSPLEELDVASFRIVYSPYVRDSNGSYFVGEPIEVDLDGAILLDNSFDAFEYYLKTEDGKLFWNEYEVMNVADIESFEIIHKHYAIDSENVYKLNHNVSYLEGMSNQVKFDIVKGANPNTFEPVERAHNYAYDLYVSEGNLYYQGNQLTTEGLDVSTVEMISDLYVVDENRWGCDLQIEEPYIANCEDSSQFYE